MMLCGAQVKEGRVTQFIGRKIICDPRIADEIQHEKLIAWARLVFMGGPGGNEGALITADGTTLARDIHGQATMARQHDLIEIMRVASDLRSITAQGKLWHGGSSRRHDHPR